MTRQRRLAQLLALGISVLTVAVILVIPAYSVGNDVAGPDGSTTTMTRYETVLAANRSHWPLLVALIAGGLITSSLAVLSAWRGSLLARRALTVVAVVLTVLVFIGIASIGVFVLPAAVAIWVVVRGSSPTRGGESRAVGGVTR